MYETDFHLSRRFKFTVLVVVALLAGFTSFGLHLWLEPRVDFYGEAVPIRDLLDQPLFCTPKRLPDVQQAMLRWLPLLQPYICFKTQTELNTYLVYVWEYP